MSKFLELHAIHPFPTNCLNRDESGAPKDCIIGGYTRSRISSQCWKRAIREYMIEHNSKMSFGTRTKTLKDELKKHFSTEQDDQIIDLIMSKIDTSANKNAIVFFDYKLLPDLIKVISDNYNILLEIIKKEEKDVKEKKNKKDKIPAAVDVVIERMMRKDLVDVALFGRMVANDEGFNVDGACAFSHSFSTNKIDKEFDYFTAVDDLKDGPASHIGTTEFNSSCHYRYCCVNIDQLMKNLNGDVQLIREVIIAFVKAFVMALPKGRQYTFAAYTKPQYIRAMIGDCQPTDRSNAFYDNPIDKNITSESIKRLEEYIQSENKKFGLTYLYNKELKELDQFLSEIAQQI